jgi:hypothetical protein
MTFSNNLKVRGKLFQLFSEGDNRELEGRNKRGDERFLFFVRQTT